MFHNWNITLNILRIVAIKFCICFGITIAFITMILLPLAYAKGWLGVSIQEVTPELAKSLGLPSEKGALIADIDQGGPAGPPGSGGET